MCGIIDKPSPEQTAKLSDMKEVEKFLKQRAREIEIKEKNLKTIDKERDRRLKLPPKQDLGLRRKTLDHGQATERKAVTKGQATEIQKPLNPGQATERKAVTQGQATEMQKPLNPGQATVKQTTFQPRDQGSQMLTNVTNFLEQASEVKNKEAEEKLKWEQICNNPGPGYQKSQHIPANVPFCLLCKAYKRKIHFLFRLEQICNY